MKVETSLPIGKEFGIPVRNLADRERLQEIVRDLKQR